MTQTIRPAQAKRSRELAKQARRQQKADRRAERKEAKAITTAADDGEDPDLAGIRPGPQPREE